MLTLAGMGLYDYKDLTLRGIDAIKSADHVYIERYTNLWSGKDELEHMCGKDIVELERGSLEQDSETIIEESKSKNVVILIPGDPLIATTHISLVEDAKRAGIDVKIIHNASIVSAIGESGLHVYKFGAIATIPFPEKTKQMLPKSVYDVIKKNQEIGYHTLLLLDITPEKRMNVKEALNILLELEEVSGCGLISTDIEMIVLSKLGSPESMIVFDKISNIINMGFHEPIALILPGELHFTERDYLDAHKG